MDREIPFLDLDPTLFAEKDKIARPGCWRNAATARIAHREPDSDPVAFLGSFALSGAAFPPLGLFSPSGRLGHEVVGPSLGSPFRAGRASRATLALYTIWHSNDMSDRNNRDKSFEVFWKFSFDLLDLKLEFSINYFPN
jgi:hypothetical protein